MSAYQNRNRNVDIEVAAHTILTFSRITIITMPADDGSVWSSLFVQEPWMIWNSGETVLS